MIFPLFLACPLQEASFERVLSDLNRLKNVEITMSQMSRNRRDEAFQAGSMWTLRIGERGQFELTASEMWGGESGLYICDGKALLIRGDMNYLRSAPKSIGEVGGVFSGGGFGSVLFSFLRGPQSGADLLAPGQTPKATSRGWKVQSREHGFLEVDVIRMNGLSLPSAVWVSDRASRMAGYLMIPMFSELPDQPIDVFGINYRFVDSWPRGTFSTKLKKGETAVDQRKKA